jgi:hypothetical protein
VDFVEHVAIHAFHARAEMNVGAEPVLLRSVDPRRQTSLDKRGPESPVEILFE